MHLTDVTLRDGLQFEKLTLSTEQKFALFEKIAACGFERIEVTSFVHPKWVPQLADAEALSSLVFASPLAKSCELMAFVPNEKGLDRLVKFNYAWASAFVAVSNSFNQKNVNSTREASLEGLKKTAERCRAEGRKLRIYISTVFGCPYEGFISVDEVEKVAKVVASFKPDEIALGDTIGVATPAQVREVLGRVAKFWPVQKTALHLHNTYGMALAGADVGYGLGIRAYDGALGGTGGCPYAKGASGNLAIEELDYLAHRQGWRRKFPTTELKLALAALKATGIEAKSQLAAIIAKGGDWFGENKSG